MKYILISLIITMLISAQTKFSDVNQLITSGEFTKASYLIDEKIKNDKLSKSEIADLQFEKERLDRIKKDFNKTSEDVLKFIQKY